MVDLPVFSPRLPSRKKLIVVKVVILDGGLLDPQKVKGLKREVFPVPEEEEDVHLALPLHIAFAASRHPSRLCLLTMQKGKGRFCNFNKVRGYRIESSWNSKVPDHVVGIFCCIRDVLLEHADQ